MVYATERRRLCSVPHTVAEGVRPYSGFSTYGSIVGFNGTMTYASGYGPGRSWTRDYMPTTTAMSASQDLRACPRWSSITCQLRFDHACRMQRMAEAQFLMLEHSLVNRCVECLLLRASVMEKRFSNRHSDDDAASRSPPVSSCAQSRSAS